MNTRPLVLMSMVVASTWGAGQTEPRAQELLALHEKAYRAEAIDFDEVESLVFNLNMRLMSDDRPVPVLSSIVIDYEGRRVRNRNCSEGRLTSDSVFRDGELATWHSELGRLTLTSASEDEIIAMIERLFVGRGSTAAPEVRYDGFVDYGIVSGEQVTFSLEGDPLFAPSESRAIFASDGALLAEVSETPQGLMLAVLAGTMRVDGRLMPLGWTLYDLSGDVPVRWATVRFWRVRIDAPLVEEMFVLDLPESDPAAEREILDRRMAELMERLDGADAAAPETKAIVEELAELVDRQSALLSMTSAPACPGPL